MNSYHLPDLVSNFTAQYWDNKKHLAYFYFSADDRLQSLGGNVEFYFQQEIELNISSVDLSPVLAGFIPFDEPELTLPNIELSKDLYIDIHILNDKQENRFCVLFLDVSELVLAELPAHQTRNDLYLKSDKYQSLMSQYVGDPIVNRLLQGQDGLHKQGERRHLCIMFADVRGFTGITERHDSQQVVHILNEFLDIMINAVLENDGMVDKIVGDGVMAVFGLLPDKNISMAEQAYNAAKRIQQKVGEMINNESKKDLSLLGTGIGIATGQVVLGVLGNTHRQMLSVVGSYVNTAQRLESQARPGEILLEENTYNEIVVGKEYLARLEVQLRGLPKPIVAFSQQFQMHGGT